MNSHERRISQRIPAQFQVNFVHEGDYLISHTRDISVDGMFLFTTSPPSVTEKTELTFSIGDLHNIKLIADVVWVNHTKSKKDSGMAVRFIDPKPELIEAILDIVKKVAIFPTDSV